MGRPRKRTEKEEQRHRLKLLYPDAIDLMEAVLKDQVKDKKGRKQRVSAGQRLEVATRIMDHVVGRPSQSQPVSVETELPPIRHVEIVKNYEVPAAEVETSVVVEPEAPATRKDWLEKIEQEALEGASPAVEDGL